MSEPATEDREARAKRLRPLVKRRLKEVRSEREGARQIGVSNTALARFLAGETPFDKTLDLYERWVDSAESDTSYGGVAALLDPDGLAELYRRIDRIEDSDAPEWLKALRTDALAATIRAEAMRQAEVASTERATAIRSAEEAAKERATTAGRAEEGVSVLPFSLGGQGNERDTVRELMRELLREAGEGQSEAVG